jgi:hypothetical protein
MKRKLIRNVLAYSIVIGAVILYLLWDQMTPVVRYAIPACWITIWFVFNWYDIFTPKAQNDPLLKSESDDKRRLIRFVNKHFRW